MTRTALVGAVLVCVVSVANAQSPSVLRDPVLGRLLHVPIAAAVPSGVFDVRFDAAWDSDLFPEVGKQRNVHFSLGLLPRISIGGRGTLTREHTTANLLASDLSATLQVLVLDEHSWRPSLAVGAWDFGGAVPYFEATYAVASKSIAGRARLTAGYGRGPDLLKGAFGGAEVALHPMATAFGEYDAHEWNAGIRVYPMPRRLESYGIPRPSIDVVWQGREHVAFGIGARTVLGESKYEAQHARYAGKRFHRPTATAPIDAIVRAVQGELVSAGFENVRVSVPAAEATLCIEYENRRFNRDQLEGMGVVLGIATVHTPASIARVRLIERVVDIPVLELLTGADAFVAFVNGEQSEDAFVAQLEITHHGPAARASGTDPANRSRFRLDLFVRPRLETTVLTDWGPFDFRFSVLPDAYVQLGPGTVVNVRAAVPVKRSANFPAVLGDPEIDRVLVHQAFRVPGVGSESRMAMTQFSVGRFDANRVGVANETAMSLFDGALLVTATTARLGPNAGHLGQWFALGGGRVRYPRLDAAVAVTAGQFLDGDRGVAVDISRFFGTTQTGVFLRHADRGSLGGFRIAMPLTVPRELRPSQIRPRLPDIYAYEQRATALTHQNILRNDLGRGLATEHELERVYWNRDRSYASFVRLHVDVFRQATRKWIDGAP